MDTTRYSVDLSASHSGKDLNVNYFLVLLVSFIKCSIGAGRVVVSLPSLNPTTL
jgi:hypothetical protein